MKKLSKEQLKNISIEENYYKTLIIEELGYRQELKDSVGYVLYHGEVSMYDLGKEYIGGYAISLKEYFDKKEESFFYEYCDHVGISENLTIDSSDEEFHKNIDYEKYGEDMILVGQAEFGEEFYDIEGHIVEIVDYDWLSEQNDPINTPDGIVACYEAVNIYLDKGNNLEDAIMYAGEKFKWEAAA